MAVLSAGDRINVWQNYMEETSQDRETIPLNKNDLKAAVDAVDDWVDDNQGAYNNALPVLARTRLTQSQKAALLMYVVQKRYEVA